MALDHFENGIFGMVAPQDWLEVGYDVARPNNPTDQLFGNIKTDNILAYWETRAAEYGIPVMAQYHAFDVESQKTMRAPIDVHNVEKGLIKVKIDQSERLRTLLSRGIKSTSRLVQEVFRDGYNLSQEVVTRSLVAKNEVLATGKMTINENNLTMTVDYGVPASNLNKTLDFGAGATAPLDEQLLALKEASTDAGAPIDTMYTSEAEFNKFRKNANIQKAINGSSMVGQLVRASDLREYLASEFGISRVLLQDLKYSPPYTMGNDGRPVASAQRYYPLNKITFLSTNGGKVGDGLWGDPPEVTAASYGMNVSGSEVSPYVYVSQYTENDPAVTWTKASALFIPAFYNPDAIYVAHSISTTGA